MGIDAFLANFPSSIGNLFRSPSGQEMIVSDGSQIGQRVYRLMSIDTLWPMLVPWPGPVLAGALGFIYVDGAAGNIRPRALPNPPNFFAAPSPPPPPEKKRTVAGGRIGSARAPVPGTVVYKIGQTTGVTWGRVLVSFLQIPIPVGPLVIIFDQILCRLTIGTGDSGSSLLMENGHHYTRIMLGFPRGEPLQWSRRPCTGNSLVVALTIDGYQLSLRIVITAEIRGRRYYGSKKGKGYTKEQKR